MLLTRTGLFIRESGWARRLSACLSVCCAAAAQLPAAACPRLHEPAFCVPLCSGWASFHAEPVVHSSLSKCQRGEIWPCVARLSPGWKCTAQSWRHTPRTHLIALKNVLSCGLVIFLCQISRGCFVCSSEVVSARSFGGLHLPIYLAPSS